MLEKIGLTCIGVAVGTLFSLAAGSDFWTPLILILAVLWLFIMLVVSLLEAIVKGKNPFKTRGK